MNEVDVCRAVLIEVLTILAKDFDKLAVVGGWVPELAFPGKGHSGSLYVDLITGEFPEIAADGTHHRIQELAVWKARGVDLAFTFQQDVFVEGTRPNRGHNKVTAKMPIIAA